jgi:hypothetical protein
MMDLLRVALGEDRIIGAKFPQERRLKRMREQQPNESDKKFAIRQYLQERDGRLVQAEKEFQQSRDMNPNGFWECQWTVKGIQWTPFAPPENAIVKIVSQGLANSNPEYIGKVIYMNRHPRSVAKSQERLRGQFGPAKNPKIGNREVRKHSPQMYVNVHKQAARWIKEFKPDLQVVDFDDLIENPARVIDSIASFLGEEGNWEQAVAQVNPKLRRSYPEEVENSLWQVAEEIYAGVGGYLWDDVTKAGLPTRERKRNNDQWNCLRLKQRITRHVCELCQKDAVTAWNLREGAKRMKIKWEEEPCLYECGIGEEDGAGLSIEESVAKNHWLALSESKPGSE